MLKRTLKVFKQFCEKKEPAGLIKLMAFGKHPACNDHIDMLGNDSSLMTRIRRLLYTDGIRSNIENGAWKELESDNLIDFSHYFHWKYEGKIVIGKLWSSSDGKGRSDYPMVMCLETEYGICKKLYSEIHKLIDSLQAELIQSQTLDDMGCAIEKAAESFNASAHVNSEYVDSNMSISDIRNGLDCDDDVSLMLERIVYHLFNGSNVIGGNEIIKVSEPGIWTFRVPKCLLNRLMKANTADEIDKELVEADLWFDFASIFFSKKFDVIVFESENTGYLDVIIGCPESAQVYCLRAGTGAIPLTTDIPYNTCDFEKQFKVK